MNDPLLPLHLVLSSLVTLFFLITGIYTLRNYRLMAQRSAVRRETSSSLWYFLATMVSSTENDVRSIENNLLLGGICSILCGVFIIWAVAYTLLHHRVGH
jgi:hypothetical protein